mmetsp:Transcript_12475/g.13879  ORF Transcript_12475/g.13879 Transcript_12475/m.13879 type:complete len:490 (+) Transcript_12475:1-1470(+)|eukprot:CAMPEP_0194138036 /NCGR_PEP_ID=MMETSP0152-20130528/7881_1 /TAXON_ID=1049557 /ORGANISM="Thalassiothrix antarctica, Strain L6-D1" /LENGTH=489 /DNA_ID=CAMNT_0038835323 /DNA_START=7 /DNA_END=1476 /DNA_ORIENTATION=-
MAITMETLLDEAEALLTANPVRPPRPDFPLPNDYEDSTPERLMILKDNGLKGRGWYTSQEISAGTVLMCAKPIVMVMDWEDPTENPVLTREYTDGDEEMSIENEVSGLSKLNEILLLELLRVIARDSSIWTNKLSALFPRTEELEAIDGWICTDDNVFLQFEELIRRIEQQTSLPEVVVKDLSKRLPLIVRYNVLSAETMPELMVHPSPQQGYAALSGTCLYHLPSFFNHDSHPNASRYAVGDVLWIVANQNVPEGVEVCISYLEHEVLCEPPSIRTLMLNMDFTEPENDATAEEVHNEDEDGPDIPVVDTDVQNEIMQMDPMDRLCTIEKLTIQALGEGLAIEGEERESSMKGDEEVMDEITNNAPWFECDVQNLRILKALTLDSLGQLEEAFSNWKESVTFCKSKLPPNDEALIVMLVQAAMCALQLLKHQDEARGLAAEALRVHSILFGGGVKRFRRRYRREFQLALRPTYTSFTSPPDELWPLAN